MFLTVHFCVFIISIILLRKRIHLMGFDWHASHRFAVVYSAKIKCILSWSKKKLWFLRKKKLVRRCMFGLYSCSYAVQHVTSDHFVLFVMSCNFHLVFINSTFCTFYCKSLKSNLCKFFRVFFSFNFFFIIHSLCIYFPVIHVILFLLHLRVLRT